MPFGSVQDLAEEIRNCRSCGLHIVRHLAVPGEGPANAGGMLIGEAPGETEDRLGRPFVGRTGKFLNTALEQAGLERVELFITSAVKCRPPGNRNPRPAELSICREFWLNQQLAAVDPSHVLLLGRMAVQQLLGLNRPLREIRGEFLNFGERNLLVTYHPTAAMRFANLRKVFMSDLQHFAFALHQNR